MREGESAQDKGVDDGELRGYPGDAEGQNQSRLTNKTIFP